MAECKRDKLKVLVCADSSEQSAWAFDCEYLLFHHVQVICFMLSADKIDNFQMKSSLFYFVLLVLNVPVNTYGHVGTVTSDCVRLLPDIEMKLHLKPCH